ncbi:hypothetical protein AMTR_s00172p00028840 [Amborella trichopoda]|uniref:Uncharacterized protein n=1 Tax=Amborella trichopoda TaxID=13333 RepID=W1PXA0_AMBTC|nr:hypothetical protein AMTR_s00172p00028840 [Amborella trichopoda]
MVASVGNELCQCASKAVVEEWFDVAKPSLTLRHCSYTAFTEVGTVENQVANGCVTSGNLPNSSGQILKKAKKPCLMSLRSIR